MRILGVILALSAFALFCAWAGLLDGCAAFGPDNQPAPVHDEAVQSGDQAPLFLRRPDGTCMRWDGGVKCSWDGGQ